MSQLKSILSHRGYSISKTGTTKKQLLKYKSDLTIIPYIEKEEYAHTAQPIKIYQETDKRLYVPRFYGAKTFGEPDTDKLTTTEPKKINFKHNINLRAIQKIHIPLALEALKTNGGGVVSLYCGCGKCLAYDTPVMMFSGKIKMVQDIKVGDLLMGDDSLPRTVKSLARGREMMYKVIPTKGEPYTVNESHILSLKIDGHKSVTKSTNGWTVKYFDHENMQMKHKYFNDDALIQAKNFASSIKTENVIDICVTDYLKLQDSSSTSTSAHGDDSLLLGYSVPVEFPEKTVKLDPYTLGLWLGNEKDNSQFNDSLFRNKLGNYNLLLNKHIPYDYICNSRKIRLLVLAGLIDSYDGNIMDNDSNCYEINEKQKTLAKDIVYLCKSLGFAAYMSNNTSSLVEKGSNYRVIISGEGLENIPLLLDHKKVSSKRQINDTRAAHDALSTRIRLEKTKVDNYYGFEIEGPNRRFLLGDFTVTHNTISAIWLAAQLGVQTAVVCHTTDLMNQWKERIEEFMPDARIGIVQQNKCQIEDRDFIIMSLKTVSCRQYDKNTFRSIGLVIYDEIHLMCTTTFSAAFPKITTKYTLGLSATPYRKDKCEAIFQNYIGPILCYVKRPKNDRLVVQCITYLIDNIELAYNRFGKVMYTTTVVKICDNEKRCKTIAKIIVELVKENRKILVLSEYVRHLETIKKLLDEHEYKEFTSGLYIGKMKNAQRKLSQQCDVILGTYKLASVGMDIPDLNTLLLASPRKEIEQSVGRILRKDKNSGIHPMIIDMIDDHGIFKRQSRERKAFYKSYGYTMQLIRMDEDGNVLSKRRAPGSKKVIQDSDQMPIKQFLIKP